MYDTLIPGGMARCDVAPRAGAEIATMAKYTVNYACGHGSREIELFGKTDDRTRKIAWMEAHVSCSTCKKAERIAADNAAPRVANIHISGALMTVDVALEGQIEANKEPLRQRGWAWSDAAVGAFGLLENRPTLRFVRTWKYTDEASLRAALADIVAVLAEIGWQATPISDLDIAMALTAIRAAKAQEAVSDAAKAAAIAANPRPARPTWYASHVPTGEAIKCNRQIYGGRSKSIYVNGTKIDVSAAQIAEIETYWRQLDAYNKAKS
jgi:hypothetical protein